MMRVACEPQRLTRYKKIIIDFLPFILKTLIYKHFLIGLWEIYIEVTFNKEGKYKGVRVLQTTHKGLIEPTIKAANNIFQTNEFLPATMDNQPVSGNLIFPLTYRIERTVKTVKRVRKPSDIQ